MPHAWLDGAVEDHMTGNLKVSSSVSTLGKYPFLPLTGEGAPGIGLRFIKIFCLPQQTSLNFLFPPLTLNGPIESGTGQNGSVRFGGQQLVSWHQ